MEESTDGYELPKLPCTPYKEAPGLHSISRTRHSGRHSPRVSSPLRPRGSPGILSRAPNPQKTPAPTPLPSAANSSNTLQDAGPVNQLSQPPSNPTDPAPDGNGEAPTSPGLGGRDSDPPPLHQNAGSKRGRDPQSTKSCSSADSDDDVTCRARIRKRARRAHTVSSPAESSPDEISDSCNENDVSQQDDHSDAARTRKTKKGARKEVIASAPDDLPRNFARKVPKKALLRQPKRKNTRYNRKSAWEIITWIITLTSAALREIRKMQKSTERQIKFTPFSRLVKEIMGRVGNIQRVQRTAIEALQEAAEMYLVLSFDGLLLYFRC